MITQTRLSIPLSVWITSQENNAFASGKKANRELESREFFRHVAEVMPIPTVITRVVDDSIVFANDLFAALMCLTPDQLLNYKSMDFYNDLGLRESLINELKEKGSILNRELSLHKPDGTAMWLLISLRLTRFRNERFIVAGFQEITEQKRILEELHKAECVRTKLEKEHEMVDLKQRFISTVSHEFRTPMTVIVTSAEVLEHYRERMTFEQQDERLQKIQQQVQQMTNLLNDVLVVSQSQTGKFKFEPEQMNLEQFCRDIVEQSQFIASPNHQVKFSATGELNQVVMDANLLRHILSNLLSNAVKYSPCGGEIRFDVARNDGFVTFRVSDSGVGIPDAAQSHLFEPFYRAKNARDIQGTGLGLAIVKDSVMMHHGSIDFQSKEGVGTTFVVDLPVGDDNSDKIGACL